MPAYIVVSLTVTDPEKFEEDRAKVPDVIRRYNGRYIVRGGRSEVLEGAPPQARQVILEFPSMDDAKAFWHSAEYAPLKALRQQASEADALLIEGL